MRTFATTRTGVRIGLAYVAPPSKHQSEDAETLQRALLARPVRLRQVIKRHLPLLLVIGLCLGMAVTSRLGWL